MTIASQLNALFAEWRIRCAGDGSGFTADGVIGEAEVEWVKARPRVLFLLKEPHDRGGVLKACGHDLRVLFRNPEKFGQNRKTVEKRIGAWAYELRALAGDPVIDAHAALMASAVMNLKKTGGGAAACDRELIAFAWEHRPFILRQLAILSPDVVVCGGTFRHVREVMGGFEPVGVEALVYWREGVLWVDHHHPASWVRIRQRHGLVMECLQQVVHSAVSTVS